MDERLIQLRAVKFVDLIVIYDTELDLINLLKAIRPNLRVIGADYIDKSFTGDDLGIEVKFNSRNHSFSSSGLRKRIQSAENLKETK
ncbi:MAG: hypothetical protein CMB77_05020 [Euryarchaeota archaeon]|nr:hypothetical protein [Euryarchaeota archaeon]